MISSNQLAKAIDSGRRLETAEALWCLREAPLLALGELAAAARQRQVPGDRVTFVIDANPNYTIFGMVTDGLDVAKTIQDLPIQDPNAAASGDLSGQQPAEAVYIEKVTIHTD